MGESIGIDSLLGGWAMPKAYSGEMRERVIAEVESGASRREAAEEFAVSASTAVIWVKCFRQTGRCAAQPRGGSISPLEKHGFFKRHKITFKKKPARSGARARGRGAGAPALDARAVAAPSNHPGNPQRVAKVQSTTL